MFESILCEVTEYDPDVLEPLIDLAVEIARRTGRKTSRHTFHTGRRGRSACPLPTVNSRSLVRTS